MRFPYNNLLNIPEQSLLKKRLTKAFFLKNFALSAAEKKLLNQAIQSMEWLASIKPATANIPAVQNAIYIYAEIQVMVCTLADNQLAAFGEKCIVLFQKYIPYQILLIVEDENEFLLNACDKRTNLKDTSKRTIENYLSTPTIPKLYKNEPTTAFYTALDFSILDKTNLETTYKSYLQAIIQYRAAKITGVFRQRTATRTAEDMANLLKIEQIEKEIISLAAQIKKETQLNRQVAMNMDIQLKRKEIQQIKEKLTTI